MAWGWPGNIRELENFNGRARIGFDSITSAEALFVFEHRPLFPVTLAISAATALRESV